MREMALRFSWSVGLWIAEGFFGKNYFIPSIFPTQNVSAMFKGRKVYVSGASAYYFDRGKAMFPGVRVIQSQFIMLLRNTEVEVGEMKSLSSISMGITKASKLGKTMRRSVRKDDDDFKSISFKCISPCPFWKVSLSWTDGCLFDGESYV